MEDLWDDDVKFGNVRHGLEIKVPAKGARLFKVHEAGSSTIEESVDHASTKLDWQVG